MRDQLLWALANETDSERFERLCVDLLSRNRFTDLRPFGGKRDHGRDAEMDQRHVHRLFSPERERVFCQFSLDKRWEEKLWRELENIKTKYEHDIDVFLFVTSQEVSGHRNDKLKEAVAGKYGWRLDLRDKRWLRLQLEDSHRDLAKRYFDIDPGVGGSALDVSSEPPVSNVEAARLLAADEFDAAAVAFRRWLKSHPDDANAWRGLAWAQYAQRHYADALVTIRHAIDLQPNDLHTQRVHASILVEKGISSNERASVITGRDIFARLARTTMEWPDYYNLGNALSQLGDLAEAREAYSEAVKRDATRANVWKNLGSVHEKLGVHDAAITCYERALELDEHLPEALLAMGMDAIRRRQDFDRGVALIDKVLKEYEPARGYWAGAWYWRSYGHYRAGRAVEAVRSLDEGLAHMPNERRLLDLKAHILSEIWQEDATLTRVAEEFFQFRRELAPNDYRPVEALARILGRTGRGGDAWGVLRDHFGSSASLPSARDADGPSEALLTALRHLKTYQGHRELRPVSYYLDLFRTNGVVVSPDQADALYWSFAEAFGAAKEEFADAETLDDPTYTALFERHVDRIAEVVVQWAEGFRSSLEDLAQPDVIEALSGILASVAMTALVEVSRQVGFLAGVFSMPANEERPLPESIGSMQGRVAAETFRKLSAPLNLGGKA